MLTVDSATAAVAAIMSDECGPAVGSGESGVSIQPREILSARVTLGEKKGVVRKLVSGSLAQHAPTVARLTCRMRRGMARERVTSFQRRDTRRVRVGRSAGDFKICWRI